MKKISISFLAFIIFSLLFASGCQKQKNDREYLKEVLDHLENIKSATYTTMVQAFVPEDINPQFTEYYFIREFDNPSDTTIGASFVELTSEDTTKMHVGYDGLVKALVFEEHKGLLLDSFKVSRAPFRLVNPPFFNYAKSIIKYALETNDSITTTFEDMGDSLLFKLRVNEDRQVEFFGKPKYIDNSYTFGDNSSNYKIWINKSDDLPYRIKREMTHSESLQERYGYELNRMDIKNFRLADYFPQGYIIREYGVGKRPKPKVSEMAGKKAPDWILKNINNQPVVLKDLDRKVLLLKFTGIGCGPCQTSIPFLKKLVEDYRDKDFELVSIETWSNSLSSMKHYAEKNELNYKFLNCTDEVRKTYKVTGVPVFFILDKDRVIRKVIKGFNEEITDKELRAAINEWL
jgi:peroxiredoxin